MSRAMFERTMKWRAKKNDKVKKLRKQLAADSGGLDMRFGTEIAGATVGEHIDSFWEYNRLVGESDGGELLGEAEYNRLRELARKTKPNRLFVSWRNLSTGMDCYNVGPDSRCFCGHSYKAHKWWETKSKRVGCRCKGCKCACFQYVVGHGKWWIKCQCKHDHVDHVHNGVLGGCKRENCACASFYSPFSCSCGGLWADHATVFETRQERAAAGKPVENLCGGADATAAASGGITRFSSLVAGIERIEHRLPCTDDGVIGDYAAARPDRYDEDGYPRQRQRQRQQRLGGGGGGGGGGASSSAGRQKQRQKQRPQQQQRPRGGGGSGANPKLGLLKKKMKGGGGGAGGAGARRKGGGSRKK